MSDPYNPGGSSSTNRPAGQPEPIYQDRTAGQASQASHDPQHAQPYGAAPGSQLPQGLAIAALVVGVIALLNSLLPVIGAVIGLVALILGIVALRRVKAGVARGRGLAIAGIVLGAISMVLSIIATVAILAFLPALMQSGEFQEVMRCAQLPTEAEQQACIDQLQQQLQPAS